MNRVNLSVGLASLALFGVCGSAGAAPHSGLRQDPSYFLTKSGTYHLTILDKHSKVALPAIYAITVHVEEQRTEIALSNVSDGHPVKGADKPIKFYFEHDAKSRGSFESTLKITAADLGTLPLPAAQLASANRTAIAPTAPDQPIGKIACDSSKCELTFAAFGTKRFQLLPTLGKNQYFLNTISDEATAKATKVEVTSRIDPVGETKQGL